MVRKHRNRAGFTLIELLVVITVIGILMGIVLGISAVAKRKSTESKTMSELQKIRDAMEEYRVQYGQYPILAGQLTDGSFQPTITVMTKTMQNPMPHMPTKDPWGRGYFYYCTNGYQYVLFSQGADKTLQADDIDGTAGDL